ncbi:MAG: pyridoxamine 5'-phosphate oxidase family protein [Candidatus Omnitrophica bacterium]|jgi:general stress protein 26|nr:pyridoxamine 5'-phosphate oxidase family protein [Candidatus Omnitrophota bacterium]
MVKLSKEIATFLTHQGFVIVSTIDPKGYIHCSAKGIVEAKEDGRVYIMDLYRSKTFSNLKNNPLVSITAVNEHEFIGYTIKGRTKIIEKAKISKDLLESWHKKVVSRASTRLIKNIRRDRGSSTHPEARFPDPQYLIEIDAEEIVDLSPAHLKQPASD